jgi:hypothetical protein
VQPPSRAGAGVTPWATESVGPLTAALWRCSPIHGPRYAGVVQVFRYRRGHDRRGLDALGRAATWNRTGTAAAAVRRGPAQHDVWADRSHSRPMARSASAAIVSMLSPVEIWVPLGKPPPGRKMGEPLPWGPFDPMTSQAMFVFIGVQSNTGGLGSRHVAERQ